MDAQYTCPSCGGSADLKSNCCPYCGSLFIQDLGPGTGVSGATAARAQAAVLEAKLLKTPNNGAALLELGKIYHLLGQYPKAQDALTKAAALMPAEPQVFLMLAWNVGIMKGWEKAAVLENARQALALDPKLAEADGLVHLSQGMTQYLFDQSILHAKMALKEFQAATESDPKNTYGFFMTGCVCEELDELKLAAQFLQKAADLSAADDAPGREDARIVARAGSVFFKLHDVDNAKKYLSRAVELDPDNDAARGLLASIDGN